MRTLAIGDVGVVDDMIHIGDEAMTEELVVQLRQRRVDAVTLLSSAPDETAARYDVDAVRPIGFAPGPLGGRDGQVERLERVLAAAGGSRTALPHDDPALAVIEAVREADAVAVAGGGNMASRWSLHVFERAALGAVARVVGRPLVVTGQTIGPDLVADDERLVSGLLRDARLFGVRESASHTLMRRVADDTAPDLARKVVQNVDDASFLGADAAPPVVTGLDAGASAGPGSLLVGAGSFPYCAVSLSTHVGDADRRQVVTALARLLDRVADETGLEIAFLAHWASLNEGEERGDAVLHRRVIDAMTTSTVRIEPTTDSVAAARFARGASLHLTSRYHPAVFAVAGGVPTVGISVDEYTRVKLTGALGAFGQTSVASVEALVLGSAARLALATWDDAAQVRARWESRVESVRTASAGWWDRVAEELGA
ncbi:polysaccharide pyruvyl transferase family protein [Frigoribacterium endophyticum]|uniref:polysaccharide pyruvyl transferase family protein n=1 Tax=Frigoribacterium endophyticum TaxID=1522176 RepID=UPI00141DE61D|nr:polysaccharide pyruvyl transferase WcaK-like protein [Frigoribacterium endophyticum]